MEFVHGNRSHSVSKHSGILAMDISIWVQIYASFPGEAMLTDGYVVLLILLFTNWLLRILKLTKLFA